MKINPELLDPHAWYAPAPDGNGHLLLNPETREPTNPNTIPEWIRNSPMHNAGVGYLAARGADVRIALVGSRHDVAEDLGPDGVFEHVVTHADYYADENLAIAAQDESYAAMYRAETLARSLQHGTDLAAFIKAGRYETAFAARTERAKIISGTPTFTADMKGDSDMPIERAAIEQIRRLDANTNGDRGLLYAATNDVREWCMVASLGLGVLKGELGKPERRVEVVQTVGDAHTDELRRKIALRGGIASDISIGQLRTPEPLQGLLARTAATGRVTPADLHLLNRLVDMHQQLGSFKNIDTRQ